MKEKDSRLKQYDLFSKRKDSSSYSEVSEASPRASPKKQAQVIEVLSDIVSSEDVQEIDPKQVKMADAKLFRSPEKVS